MLTYEEFKEVIKERMEKEFPEPYVVEYSKKEKVNQVVDSVSVRKDARCECGLTMYFNGIYEDYKENRNLDAVIKNLTAFFKQELQRDLNNMKLDFSQAEDNIVCQIINTEKNKEMLANMPHREFLDLSIVYRWIVKSEDGVVSCLVKNGLLKQLGLTEEQLFDLAWENTKRLRPPVVRSMKDCLSNILPEKLISDVSMYILSNEFMDKGAIYMTDTDILSDIAEKLDSDLYVLPSSLHECIALPSTEEEANTFLEMVSEVNQTSARVEERLSNNIYYFDRDSKELNIVPNNNCKSLNDLEN